ncbi:hypothetical protein ACS3UN_11980 [Oscillospiraceae bacterium LTW-04]|nr:hypothetical protein RBH76_13720 [Oscillospiraceae bacterium MB24-C1]
MKKKLFILVVLTSLLLTVFLAGCSKAESVEESSSEIISEATTTLADYDGWWYIDDDSHDGVSMIEIFRVDAQAQEITVYNNEGFTVATLSAIEGSTGELILDLELFGEVPMVLLDSDTLTCKDGMTFRRGEPLPEPDYSSFTGIWYQNGDENGGYYKLSNDGSYEYYVNSKTEEAIEKGTYTFSTMTRYIGDSEPFESPCLTMDDGSGFTDDFYLLESGVGLMGSGFDKNFYIRSDALGTTSGDNTIFLCTLVLKSPWQGDNGNYLIFMEDGTFKLSTADESGEVKPYDGGKWSANGQELFLVWENDEEETAEYQVENEIFVPSLKEIFAGMW